MRVMIYYGSIFNGGAEKVIVALANHLVHNGNDVYIVVSDDGRCGYELSSGVIVIPLNNVKESVSFSDAVRNNLKTISALKRHIREIHPDLIVSFDPRDAVTAKISCGTSCNCVIGSERSNPYFARKRKIDKLFVMLTPILDGYIFQTNGAKVFYPPKTQKKSIVIPNGLFVDIDCDIYGVSMRQKKKICASGRLSKVKRYDLMILAMKELVKNHPELELHIFGDGDQKQEIESFILRNALEQNVILKGRTEHIYEELVKYRYFFLTSDSEGTPNGLIDAMACGCVCVSADCDFGPSDLITDGENGFLIPTDAYLALAEKMETILKMDDDHLQRISDNAQTIRTRLSREATLQKYEKYITECASR